MIESALSVQKLLNEQNLTALFSGSDETVTGQIPAAGQSISGGSQMIVYFGDEAEVRTVEVPDFAGMNRQQAADAAGKLGLYILVTGNSEISTNVVATSQSVPPGQKVDAGTMIKLEFTDTVVRD